MLTNFGKELRRIRLERDELLKDMANKLHVTSAYLSAIETGKRSIPEDYIGKISELYDLDGEEKERLIKAKIESTKQLKINMEKSENSRKEMAMQFARKFDSLSQDEIKDLMSILKGDD